MSRARALKTLAKLVGKRTAPYRPKARLEGPTNSERMMQYGSTGREAREGYIRKTTAAFDKRVGGTGATLAFQRRQGQRVNRIVGERKKAQYHISMLPKVSDSIPTGMLRYLSKLPDEAPKAAAHRKALYDKAHGRRTRKRIQVPSRRRRK